MHPRNSLRKGVLLAAAAIAGGGVLSAAPAMAQTGVSSAAERCRALPTEAERFACMDEALAAAEAAAAGRSSGGGGLLGLGLFGGGGADSDPVPSDSPAAQTLGAEQVARRENRSADVRQEEPRVQATVVSFRERLPGLLQFELDNGQIWNQTGADTQRVRLSRNRAVDVEMWQAWSGGYRMHLLDLNRVLLVERVR